MNQLKLEVNLNGDKLALWQLDDIYLVSIRQQGVTKVTAYSDYVKAYKRYRNLKG